MDLDEVLDALGFALGLVILTLALGASNQVDAWVLGVLGG